MIKVALIPNDFYTSNINFEVVLRFCVKQRVKYVEIASMWGKSILDLDESELARVHELLDSNRIKVASIQTQVMKVYPPGSNLSKPGSKNMHKDYEYNISMIDTAIDRAKEFDTKYIVTYSYFTHLKKVGENLWKKLFKDYEMLIGKCKAASKTMVLECEGDTVIATIDDYMRLFEHFNSPHLKANLDLSNLYSAQDTFSKSDFKRIKDHVEYFHMKDKKMFRFLPKLLRKYVPSQPRVLDTGDVPWRKVIPAFAKSGFDGVLSVEPHVHGKNKFERCRRCVQNLQKMLKELNIAFE